MRLRLRIGRSVFSRPFARGGRFGASSARRSNTAAAKACTVLKIAAMGDWMKSFNDIAGYAKNVAQQASTMVAGSELEKKLAEATSNEPWGASSARCSLALALCGYGRPGTCGLGWWSLLPPRV